MPITSGNCATFSMLKYKERLTMIDVKEESPMSLRMSSSYNVREWNNLQYASSAAFLLAMYSDYLFEQKVVLACPQGQVQPSDVFSFAKSQECSFQQADYILGKNPKAISYVVGYGQNYPIRDHHRGASVAPISVLHAAVSCIEGFETWYRRPQANPNIIHGALVGGPSKTDDFSDDRSPIMNKLNQHYLVQLLLLDCSANWSPSQDIQDIKDNLGGHNHQLWWRVA